ncbi:MAG: hypothetical protein U1B78_07420, partial [Dehalococcoidia bacterium]|nr:hypothetical protein [Dehalococcoidia bacterium]
AGQAAAPAARGLPTTGLGGQPSGDGSAPNWLFIAAASAGLAGLAATTGGIVAARCRVVGGGRGRERRQPRAD